MKVQCDVCSSGAATVFCSADEAALCGGCDRRIHSMNKLARKHVRFSLLSPTHYQPPPLCDICQEKRAFLFCKQDRAVLCQDCDVSIHTASIHTMKHSRFLLAGITLSSSPIDSAEAEAVPDIASNSSDINQGRAVVEQETFRATTVTTSDQNCGSSSSISEYLTKMLPGWHVEDFLFDDPTTTANAGSFQEDELHSFVGTNCNYGMSPGGDGGVQGLPVWVPPHGYLRGGIVDRDNCKEARSSRQKRQRAEAVKVPEICNGWSTTDRHNSRYM